MLLLNKFIKEEYRDKNLFFLLLIGWLYSIGLFLSNTFVNIYLWRQTEDFIVIAFFHLSIYVLKSITFIFAGKLTKKIDRIIVLRIGFIFLSIFFLTVLYLQDRASTYNILLGSLLGIGYGFYWLAFNVLSFEITEPHNRVFFNGWLGGLQSVSGMLAPLLAGTLILKMKTNIGYMTIFSISFSLFILAMIISFFVQRRETDGVYNLGVVIREVGRNDDWRNILIANLFQGIRDGVFLFVISIWIFLATRNEFALGMFNLYLNGSSFIVSLLITRFTKNNQRKRLILIGSLIISFAIWIVLTDITFQRLIIYALIVGIGFPIIIVPFQSLTYDIIGKGYEARNLRIEYIVLLEIFSNLGSIFSIMIFILTVSIITIADPIPYLLALFSLSYFLIYLYVRRLKLFSVDKT